MSQLLLDREPIQATEGERGPLQELDALLAGHTCQAPKLVLSDGEVVLPPSAYRVLRRVVEVMARGDAVSVLPVHQELTTQEAADLLNISRPSLVRLLETGAIPFRRLRSHRRLRLHDVLAYKHQQQARQAGALERLTEISERYFDEAAEQAYYADMVGATARDESAGE